MEAIVGFISLAILIALLMRGKSMPIVIFAIVPILAALALGFSFAEVGDMVDSGLSSVYTTAVLFIFSVSYFGIMNDAGMFDPIVDGLIKRAGSNVIMVTVATGIVAILGHLDGTTATTALITIPAMLPLYKRMNIRPINMLVIVGVAMGVMNLVPWGGPIVRVATVLEMDTTELWRQLIPFQVVCIIATLAIAAFIGVIEKKRGAGAGAGSSDVADAMKLESESPEVLALKRPKLTGFNLGLTLVLVICLVADLMPSYLLFMIAFSLAIVVNYPNTKDQRTRFKAHAGEALDMSATLLAAGVFIGIMNSAGLLEAMVDVLLTFMPEALGRYMNIIAGLFSVPVGAILGADTFYYGVFPLLGEVAENFGVPQLDVGVAMLIGKNVGMIVSPLQPTTYLACGLAGVELKDHLRVNFKWMWLISILMVVIALLMGVMNIY